MKMAIKGTAAIEAYLNFFDNPEDREYAQDHLPSDGEYSVRVVNGRKFLTNSREDVDYNAYGTGTRVIQDCFAVELGTFVEETFTVARGNYSGEFSSVRAAILSIFF
jgi:hypothetical protein